MYTTAACLKFKPMTAPLNPFPFSTHRIRFDDCDPFGHLNNISYQRYFLRAREDHALEFYQFDIFRHTLFTKKGWVVSAFQIRYLVPAMMNDVVLIESALVQYNESSLWVEAVMYDLKREKVKALAWMHFTYIDTQTGRRTTHDDEFTALMAAVLVPDHPAAGLSFEQRGDALKGENQRKPQQEP